MLKLKVMQKLIEYAVSSVKTFLDRVPSDKLTSQDWQLIGSAFRYGLTHRALLYKAPSLTSVADVIFLPSIELVEPSSPKDCSP